MTTATLSRGSTSVTFDIWKEGGELLVARDIGKPQGGVKTVSRVDPRSSDNMSALDRLTVVGRLEGANAYADALTLAEELVKQHSGGTNLTLDLSNLSGYSTYAVGVPDQRALELDYRPGVVDVVDLQMSLPIVSSTLGGSSSSTSTSTTSGSGPLTLSRGGTSISLTDDLAVTRQVGRPESKIRGVSGDLPNYIDKSRSAKDIFEVSGEFTTSNARSDATTLVEDIIRSPLGRNSLTLDFQGLWGLGSYDVFPGGSQAGRVSIEAGRGPGYVAVNKLALRVVSNS